MLAKKLEGIIDIGQGAKGWTWSISKQYFHMTEEEQAAITDLFYIFFIHLKDYFNIKVFPAIIFSKILDFVLDKEFFFIHT